MNKRDRVIAAMNNHPVDRPPVGFWFHFPEEEQLGQKCIDAHLRYYNNVDTDIAKLMCDGYFDYPNPVAKAVKKASDWFDMQPHGPGQRFHPRPSRACQSRQGRSHQRLPGVVQRLRALLVHPLRHLG